MRRWIDRLWLRLRALTRGTDLDRALRAEIDLHVDEQTAENIAAGMRPDEARAAALRAFGPVGRIEEECRDVRRVAFFSNLAQDLRYTLRSLVRQPLLLLTAVLSIAVAVERQRHDIQPRQRAAARASPPPPARISSSTSGWSRGATCPTPSGATSTRTARSRASPATRSKSRSTGRGATDPSR